MREFKIKPTSKDVIVRDPMSRKPLDMKGEVKPRDVYWLRRLQDKSVIEMIDTDKKKGAKS